MEQLPCEGCRGLCCGPVPVTETELKKIKKSIKAMPQKKRMELANQQRFFGTCLFYDVNNDRCGIHAVRPDVCRMFGYYKEMICFRMPQLATKTDRQVRERPVGILSVDFTWHDFR
ncbi:YkgJ family cysteine cluster protein [Brevibacillus fluminis]|uniref:YkgJ family cysteine cluster protein n=1 Tax=Brevibacillus fluminis TaxID=511487 RepID=A0A3M8CSI9_9BACL|nr:YkgJ family cysteine cluster protein [Brevibacillus fluminis]RNB78766.1 YkgJ family cysteine cluster protein [Brevibacillus fluminis]